MDKQYRSGRYCADGLKREWCSACIASGKAEDGNVLEQHYELSKDSGKLSSEPPLACTSPVQTQKTLEA
jgi:hypothetical protein